MLNRKRLLILNWRDPWHPKSGGAELVTYRLAQQLTSKGWAIEWFSAAYPGAAPAGTRDGIRFVRYGSQLTVHLHAFRRYHGTRSFDVIVDEINTVPFFARFYGGAPVVTLMFQLAREVWLKEAPIGLAQLGYLAERLYLLPYRRSFVITAAASAAESFRGYGFKGKIKIMPIAVDEIADESIPAKDPARDIITLSRMAPSKRVEHAIKAAAILARSGWCGNLHIVGSGSASYLRRLKRLAVRLNMEERVIFHGRVSDGDRQLLLRRSSALWMCSFREGWGLVVTEAARHGTPSVVYDSVGLRDAVLDGATGYTVQPAPANLAAATQGMFESRDYEGFADRALQHSRQFSWERTATVFEQGLFEAMNECRYR